MSTVAKAPAENSSGEERAAPAEPAGGSTDKRRVRGEADEAGGAAKKKPRSVCPHQRQRNRCKECGGASICQHQRIRSTCKECGGAGICQHQRRRSTCKECGAANHASQRVLRRARSSGRGPRSSWVGRAEEVHGGGHAQPQSPFISS